MKTCYTIKLVMLLLLIGWPGILVYGTKGEEEPQNEPGNISFIENKGQWGVEIKYKAEIPGGAFFLTDQGFVYNFCDEADWKRIKQLTCGDANTRSLQYSKINETIHHHAYKVSFLGAQRPTYQRAGLKSYYHNYFIGNKSNQWADHVSLSEKVTQHDIYEGIDMIMYSTGSSLKYDFIIAPGSDPNQIILVFEGVHPQLTKEGALYIKTSVNEITEKAPYVYQTINGQKVMIKSRYKLIKNQISFELPEGYHKEYPLIIDPTLIFSTFSGCVGNADLAMASTYDQSGNLYTSSHLSGNGWPTTLGAFQMEYANGLADVAINKYNATGTQLLYSTYYGGSDIELPLALITNANQELILAGTTKSPDIALPVGGYDQSFNGKTDLFVVKFNTTGSAILAGTYIGTPEDEGTLITELLASSTPPVSLLEITLDQSENLWIASNTNSSHFPVTLNALQSRNAGGVDGIVLHLNTDYSKLLYSTYIGGIGHDLNANIVMNHAGNVVVCGSTKSQDFPTTAGTIHTNPPGGLWDGFVCILNSQTGVLLQSTYLGTTDLDQAFRLQVDESDNIYVLGRTLGNYPISSGVYAIPESDVFIDKLSPDLKRSLLSTRTGNQLPIGQVPIGGSQNNNQMRFIPSTLLYDVCGNIYVTGFDAIKGLPVTPDAYESSHRAFWFCVFKQDFAGIAYASYFGAPSRTDHAHAAIHRFDPQGIVYQTICTPDEGFPTTANAVFPNKKNHGVDNACFKFDFESRSKVISRFQLPAGMKDSVCIPATLEFINTSVSATQGFTWDFGDGSPLSHDTSVTHTFSKPGRYKVTLYAHNESSCNRTDTSYRFISVFSVTQPSISTTDTLICDYNKAVDLAVNIYNPTPQNRILWQPANGILGSDTQINVSIDPAANNFYIVTVWDTIPAICGISTSDTVYITYVPRQLAILNKDTTVCEGSLIRIRALGTPGYTYRWSPGTAFSDSTALEQDVIIREPNTYLLTAHYPGCPDTSSGIRIGMHYLPQVELGPDKAVCQDATVTLESKVEPYRVDYTYQWFPLTPDMKYPYSPNTYYIADSTTTHYLTVQTPIGCSGMDSINITVYPRHFGSIMADTGLCLPDQINLWAAGGLNYAWSPPYGLNDTTVSVPIAAPASSTVYTVYITNSHDCKDTQQIYVQVYPNATITLPDTIRLYPGEIYHLEPETNCLHFAWFPPSGINDAQSSNPFLYPEVRTRYFVRASTEWGCFVKDSIDILVENDPLLDMPNAFHPGSGPNGYLKPVRRGWVSLKYFQVYNRWGQVVFETNDIEKGWDGSFNGLAQPMGVYLYRIEAISKTGKTFQLSGNITMVR